MFLYLSTPLLIIATLMTLALYLMLYDERVVMGQAFTWAQSQLTNSTQLYNPYAKDLTVKSKLIFLMFLSFDMRSFYLFFYIDYCLMKLVP